MAFLGQAVLYDTLREFAAPFVVIVFGSCMAFFLVSALRVLFPPMEKRPKFASTVEHRVASFPFSAFNSELKRLAEESPRPGKRLFYGALIVLVNFGRFVDLAKLRL